MRKLGVVILINCLEMHYGSLSNAIMTPDILNQCLNEIEQICYKYKRR